VAHRLTADGVEVSPAHGLTVAVFVSGSAQAHRLMDPRADRLTADGVEVSPAHGLTVAAFVSGSAQAHR